MLEAISQEHGFYFAYNSKLVAEDSVIALSGFRGSVATFLDQTFGSEYEFKEAPGYVIIRYAPRSLEVTFTVEHERKGTLVIEGRIRDAANNADIEGASIYEPNVLASTLSDAQGRFRLAIRRRDESVWLRVRKANYRDTTLVLLPAVQVHPERKERRYTFYPGADGKSGLENSRLGRFFSNSKRRIQRINLGGFFAHSPYQVSLAPGLSSQGFFNSQIVNELSLNIIGGYTAGVSGVEIAGAFNINEQHAKHFQAAGIFNLVGHDVQGVQLAGVSNTVINAVSGVQVAGVGNWAGDVRGVQLSGAFNKADNTRGVQVAGALNTSDGDADIQVAGILNVGGKVRGIQIATLLNIADSSDYPIAIVNLIKNGRKSVSAGADESGMLQLTFRSGGRVLYGLIGVGHHLANRPAKYGIEAGIGACLLERNAYLLNVEVASRTTTDLQRVSASNLTLRLLPELRIGQYIAVSAGPALIYSSSDPAPALPKVGNDRPLRPGFYGGLSFRW
ncbi:hypothetical protein ACFOET_20340 [Parapedobacter deserti]|uniref:Carboxypeptidase-like regulatory domain-containing protein n=2 Tax=Parapedobacter deserti TaxID=1912957 RepID=A0ABV7JPR6_9SPHI